MKKNDNRIVTLVKDGEKYVFSYRESNRAALLKVFSRLAVDPQLNFTWRDAVALTKKTRRDRLVLSSSPVDRAGYKLLPSSTFPERTF